MSVCLSVHKNCLIVKWDLVIIQLEIHEIFVIFKFVTYTYGQTKVYIDRRYTKNILSTTLTYPEIGLRLYFYLPGWVDLKPPNQTDIQLSNGNLSFNSQIGAVSILRRASKNQFIFDLRSDDQDPKKLTRCSKKEFWSSFEFWCNRNMRYESFYNVEIGPKNLSSKFC